MEESSSSQGGGRRRRKRPPPGSAGYKSRQEEREEGERQREAAERQREEVEIDESHQEEGDLVDLMMGDIRLVDQTPLDSSSLFDNMTFTASAPSNPPTFTPSSSTPSNPVPTTSQPVVFSPSQEDGFQSGFEFLTTPDGQEEKAVRSVGLSLSKVETPFNSNPLLSF